jgi:hypothetical protein
MPAAERQEKLRLRLLVHHHSFLHLHLLWDALILGLACILETPGWDQRASVSKKITLKHFVQKLKGNQKVKAESLFKEVMS